MLLWHALSLELMLALEDLYGDVWFSSREAQNMEVLLVMFSLDVSRCAGDINKTNVNTTNKCLWDIGKRDVFEAVASGGAGDLPFTMNLAQQQKWCFYVFDGLNCDRSRQRGLR